MTGFIIKIMDENNKNDITENEDISAGAGEAAEESGAFPEAAEENESPANDAGSAEDRTDEPEDAPEEAPDNADVDSDSGVTDGPESEDSEDEPVPAEPDEPEENEPMPEPEEVFSGEAEDAPDGVSDVPVADDDFVPGEDGPEAEELHDESKATGSPWFPRMPVRYYIVTGAVLVALFAVTLLVIFAAKGLLTPYIGRVEALFNRRSVSEYSARITGSEVKDAGVYKNNVLLLSDTALVSFNSSAKQKLVQAVSFDEPAVAAKKNCVLLYERSGTAVTLIKGNNKILYSDSAPKSIIDADTGSSGRFCLAMRDDEYKCSVMIFDPSDYTDTDSEVPGVADKQAKNDNLTYWFSDGYITDVVCDNACRYIGVSLIRADNAVVNSEFYVVDTRIADTSSFPKYTLQGETIAGTTILKDGSFFIVTDAACYTTDGGGLEKVAQFDDDLEIEFTSLSFYAPPAVLLSSYGLKDSGRLLIFNKEGKLRSTVNVEGRTIGMDSSKRGVAVMTTDRILTFTSSGLLVGETKADRPYENVVFKGNFLYLQSVGEMTKTGAFHRPKEG